MQHSLPLAAPRPPPASRPRLAGAVPGSRPELAGASATADITRGAARLIADLGYRGLTEMRLANRRRADIIGLDGRGRFAIVEVKSSLADLRADDKWSDYLAFCDHFYFAVAADFPLAALPGETGVIVADRFAGAVLRPAPLMPMTAAARRTQTLLFAHVAAARLSRVSRSAI